MIVERRLFDVEIEHRQFARVEDVDDRVLLLLHPVDPRLILLPVLEVDLARGEGEIAARVGEDVAVDDPVELRLAAEILRVGDERHRFLRLVLAEHEGAGADRLLGEFLAHLLGRLLAHHVAALIVDEQPEEARHLVLQGDPDRVLVDGLDLVEILEVARERGTLGVGGAGQRVDDVIGGELAIAVMALHALAQAERPLLAVRRRFPALGEIALHQCRIGVHRALLHPHEAVEHPVEERLVRRRRRQMRIEPAGIDRRHPDGEDRLDRVRGRCSRRHGENRCKRRGAMNPTSHENPPPR